MSDDQATEERPKSGEVQPQSQPPDPSPSGLVEEPSEGTQQAN